MGDRNNPIKFGPEWLRNLARERSAAGRSNTTPNAPRTGNSMSRPTGSQGPGSGSNTSGPGTPGGTGSSGPATSVSPPNVNSTASGGNSTPTPGTSSGTTNTNNNPVPKVQLAKMRYGREEMLALYDRTAEAPEELKGFDLIYQPRGKPPVALNTFEEETRGGPPIGAMPQERFGIGRGAGRGAIASEPRGKSRMPFVRHPLGLTSGRGSAMHSSNTRSLGFPGTEEETSQSRPWSASNGSAQNRTEQGEWGPNKMYRRRHPSNTNWRQTSRDESDEWRNQENSRNRSNVDKWDRDWSERPIQDRPQSFNSSRRQWLGDSQNNEDNLPEWAVDNAEAGAGTFDSSGAFHGYSNDDSNLPKSQETTYPLTRSHTHGSFARSKTAEEGSEEWWASEKAKKLSPKRFDTGEVKFKKSLSTGSSETTAGASSNTGNVNMDDLQEIPEKLEKPRAETDNSNHNNAEESQETMRQKFSESKTFDALMRSDIDFTDSNDDRGNFQSVMITPNNSLRQKHQNIVTSNPDPSIMQSTSSGLLHILHGIPLSAKNKENDSTQTTEEKIVEDLIDMTLEESPLSGASNNVTNQTNASKNLLHQLPNKNPGIQLRIPNPIQSHTLAMNSGTLPSAMQTAIQNVGIQNSALNSSLGLPIGPPGNNGMVLPLPLPPVMQNAQMNAINTAMQSRAVIGNFQPNNGIPVMPTPNVANNTLFMGQNNAPQLPSPNDMPLANHGNQNNLFPMHGLQHTNSQTYTSIYNNIIQNQNLQNTPNAQNLADQWYYEDPKPWDENKKIIQGPFSSKEMYNWYRAGFFSPSLMVRRAYETHMRPLGSYGPVVPFAQMDVLSPFPMSGFESRPQGYDMLNQQPNLGIEVAFNNFISNVRMTSEAITSAPAPPVTRPATEHPKVTTANRVEQIQFGIQAQRLEQRQMESLWGQPGPSQDIVWMQQTVNARNESSVNNLPMYFWDPQPSSAISSNSLLPEEIAKEMKTEDQILAQLRASQNIPTPPTAPFLNDTTTTTNSTAISNSSDAFSTVCNTPDLEKLQKLMESESIMTPALTPEAKVEKEEIETPPEKPVKTEPIPEPAVKAPPAQPKQATEKTKQAKTETEKPAKVKEQTKSKKKAKEEKKEDNEAKIKEEETKSEKASVESSPAKNKKEDKQSKKELEKEKKEWIKEGFTIVKGPEKVSKQEGKKKAEENKAAEEAEKKKKDEEKQQAEEERKRKLVEATNKQKEQQQRQILESLSKKAPWSATQATTTNKDGLTLAEIQRLEREKKLEQIKEQQHMMQLIAQQQAAALAREQVINDNQNLPWSKKKSNNGSGQSLAEIQAETRRQSAQAAAAQAAQAATEEPVTPQPQTNHVPWGNSHNGGHKKILENCLPGGFWDTQPNTSKTEKPQEPAGKPEKKKKAVVVPKKETSPMAEFESWCGTVLTSWSSKIDVPTFVGFLKDIESPYEVKDYVKCYLGDSKEANDFARHFLERRSKLLRVGMVTPSDDLCSPAMAVNPRVSLSDYQEVKGKGKKSKKNKMLKVDARILGFSVTASEDRINVGDIDTEETKR